MFSMLIKSFDNPVSPYLNKTLLALNLLFLLILFASIYRDNRYYKKRIKQLQDYRSQKNQFRRRQAEYDRQIAELRGNPLCNPLHDMDNH